MMDIDSSYQAAESIARASGSSFYRSFDFLQRDRRRAMFALYAFARLVDNAADDPHVASHWKCESWLAWLKHLCSNVQPLDRDEQLPTDLDSIRLAMSDAIQRYHIPIDMLCHLVQGVDMDVQGIRINTWNDLKKYAFRVASTVGICCLSIWTDGKSLTPSGPEWNSAVDCGIAFQLTNILRDLREDAVRGRIYLPSEDLERFGVDPVQWLEVLRNDSLPTPSVSHAWLGLIQVQCERAKALFENGWQLGEKLEPDSFRMFSLMWHTYRRLLEEIERSPETALASRTRLSKLSRMNLIVSHCLTPVLARRRAKQRPSVRRFEQVYAPKNADEPPRVAVIGGGLAGMNASLHLARHGCRVTLLEAKSRLGGRAGSFVDTVTGQAVDYCQHVGMHCCKELRRWIELTRSDEYWRSVDTLHFVSNHGKRIAIRGWPLPAPLHLSGLLLRWPELTVLDRIRVGLGLACLLRAPDTAAFQYMPAIQWLEKHFQNRRTIANFWTTILVSALGEQIDRVAMGPVKKVLVDGFAATQDAYHLLVPKIPLAQWIEGAARQSLMGMKVDVRCGAVVSSLHRRSTGEWLINSENDEPFDAIVVTVPWHRIASLLEDAGLPKDLQDVVASTDSLESSPITGVHTWWDRPWLEQPHAILVDRLCQWVFPGPESGSTSSSPEETYYQIVISGSRQLPKGNPDAILNAVRNDLAEVFPESARSTLLRGRVVTDPQSVFSVSPGHASCRLDSGALAGERIFIGGDWTDTGWPATMEGALRSGLFAAEDALAFLGRPASLSERNRASTEETRGI